MTPERWQQVKALFLEVQQRHADRRDAFLRSRCGEDDELRRELASLLAADDRRGAFLVTGADPAWLSADLAEDVSALDAGLMGHRLGPYQILQRVGRGGMGEVYLAERVDAAYEKRVAIKVVRAGGDFDLVRQRFHDERQILARLEHPNIARLLDAGTTDDGRPFFVMEYVEGEPILQYCDARRLAVRRRLELFRTVCAAVHYAHQNLIVHRDLKPENILVTPEGQAKLLDFGIAKLLRPDTAALALAPTATALRFMTLEYASPEQVRGEPITTAADVYSLGIVLYELLAGRRPFRFTGRPPQEVLAAICEVTPLPPSAVAQRPEAGDVVDAAPERPPTVERVAAERDARPDQLRRQLSGDVDMVVLMALRKEPARRYASVDQFAEDIRRHLGGLPVRARRDTLGYRTGKFVRRHRAAVAAAVLALASLLAGIAGIAWQVRVARSERARAERRFEDVRQLANAFIFDVHDAIEPLPGATKARQVVVSKALEYLDRLFQESGGHRVLQDDLAMAYQRVGDVQGLPLAANLGDTQGALASYRRALALREALAAAGDAKARRGMSVVLNRMAQVLLFNGDVEGARGASQRSVTIAEELAGSGTADARRDLMIAYLQLADAQLESNDMAATTEHHRRAVALAEELHRERHDERSARDLTVAYDRMVRVLRDQGRRAEALDLARKALEMDRAAIAVRPAEEVPQRDLAVSLYRVGMLLVALGRADEAMPPLEESLALSRRRLAADPHNVDAHREACLAEFGLGEALALRGDFTRALAHHRGALAITEKLIAKEPDSATYRGDKAESLWRMGAVLAAQGNRAAALDHTRRSAQVGERLATEAPEDLDLQAKVVAVQAQMADLEGPSCAASRAWLEKSVAGARRLQERGAAARLAEHKVSLEALLRHLARCTARAG